MQDYERLFSGAARLGLLLAARDLPWERVAPFVGLFSEELNTYVEHSLDWPGQGLGIMTRGAGKGFAHRAARYMEDLGMGEPAVRRLLVAARFFDHQGLYFKVEVGPQGPLEAGWYFRRNPPLDVARAFLADNGVSEEEGQRFDQVARVLDRHTVHFLAAAERPGQPPLLKTYFALPQEPGAWERVREALHLCGIPQSDSAALAGLEGCVLYFSIGYREGRVVPGAKVDAASVEPAVVERLAPGQELGVLLDLSGRGVYDYAGFRMAPGEGVRVRVYQFEQGGR